MDYTFIDGGGLNLEQSAVRKKNPIERKISQIIVLDYDRMQKPALLTGKALQKLTE